MKERQYKWGVWSWANNGGVQGRVALLGDSAHAMQPNLGQGGCMAIEDGYQLAVDLVNAVDESRKTGRPPNWEAVLEVRPLIPMPAIFLNWLLRFFFRGLAVSSLAGLSSGSLPLFLASILLLSAGPASLLLAYSGASSLLSSGTGLFIAFQVFLSFIRYFLRFFKSGDILSSEIIIVRRSVLLISCIRGIRNR